jgi:hypothetical protein
VGQPDLTEAWAVLTRLPPAAPVLVEASPGVSAAYFPEGATDSVARFTLRAAGVRDFRLTADVPWLLAPSSVSLRGSAAVAVRIRTDRVREPGVHTGVISGWDADSIYGPAFRLVTTVVVPRTLPADEELVRLRIPEGQLRRIPILADSGRGLRLQVGDPRGAPLLAFLFEPGGMPWRGGNALAAGGEDSVAVFEIGGSDARKGVYELVLMAGPALAVSPDLIIDPAPARLAAERRKDQVTLKLAPTSSAPVTVSGELTGAERGAVVSGRGSADVRLPFTLPAWARHVVVELTLERDQWPLFTDFGLTLVEEGGRQLATSPMNYAIGRLETDLPEGGDRAAEIVLSPGFAAPGAEHRWSGRVAIRLYAETPLPLGASLGATFRLPESPWKLPDAFFPLANFIMHANGRKWIRETGLPEAPGPLMP